MILILRTTWNMRNKKPMEESKDQFAPSHVDYMERFEKNNEDWLKSSIATTIMENLLSISNRWIRR